VRPPFFAPVLLNKSRRMTLVSVIHEISQKMCTGGLLLAHFLNAVIPDGKNYFRSVIPVLLLNFSRELFFYCDVLNEKKGVKKWIENF
jgi:hypothetical protein